MVTVYLNLKFSIYVKVNGEYAEDILWRRTKLGLAFDEKQVKNLESYLAGRRQKDDAA